MNKSSATVLGLTIAIAMSAGGVVQEHPLYTDPAPRVYSDITVAEADNQKVPLDESKSMTPDPNPNTGATTAPVPSNDSKAAEQSGQGYQNKGNPTRRAESAR
jgi:hypothetical protein